MTKGKQQTFSYNRITRLGITPFFFFVKTWPRWFARGFAWFVTAAYYPFFTRRRHNYQANLRHILGRDTSNWVLFATTFRMLINYAYYLIDLFRYEEGDEHALEDILSNATGYEHLQAALKGGKGAILLTAHLGNWEMGGIVLSKLGHPVNIVYFPDGSERIEKNRTRQRLMRGVKEIRLEPGNISPLSMMRALQAGELVAIQGDKLYHDKGAMVKFFDAPAYFPRGPVMLAMLAESPILPSFIVIDKKGKYNIIVEAPIYMDKTGDRERDIEANLGKVVPVLQKYIGQYYDQWYIMTKFWGE